MNGTDMSSTLSTGELPAHSTGRDTDTGIGRPP